MRPVGRNAGATPHRSTGHPAGRHSGTTGRLFDRQGSLLIIGTSAVTLVARRAIERWKFPWWRDPLKIQSEPWLRRPQDVARIDGWPSDGSGLIDWFRPDRTTLQQWAAILDFCPS